MPGSYLLNSIFIGMSLYIIYYFFGIFFEDTFYGANIITIPVACILIAVQLFGTLFFLKELRSLFSRLNWISDAADQSTAAFDLLKEHFTTSKGFYLVMLTTFLPLILIKINAFFSNYKPFNFQGDYHGQAVFWALMLDIYENFISFFILYLLAIFLWMIFNIYWILSKVDDKIYYKNLKIKPLHSGRAGGLETIRLLILRISIYFFFTIVLAVFTYLTSRGPLLYENISLALFWLIGLIFSFMAWFALRKLLKRKIESEISSLDEILEDKRLQLIDLITNSTENKNKEKMDSLSQSLDIIDKERNRIIGNRMKPFDARTIVLFISSSFLSLIMLVQRIESALSNAQKSKIIMFAVNQSQPYLGDSIHKFLQYFSN